MVRRAVFLCFLAMAVPSAAGEQLAMRVSPKLALEPALLTVQTTVEANADNRALEIVAESADFYRSSSIQLDGANAPRLNVFEFKNLPTGTYDVTSVLVGSAGHRAIVSTQRKTARLTMPPPPRPWIRCLRGRYIPIIDLEHVHHQGRSPEFTHVN